MLDFRACDASLDHQPELQVKQIPIPKLNSNYLDLQELSCFEVTLFSHLIHEKVDTLFRDFEFGCNP